MLDIRCLAHEKRLVCVVYTWGASISPRALSRGNAAYSFHDNRETRLACVVGWQVAENRAPKSLITSEVAQLVLNELPCTLWRRQRMMEADGSVACLKPRSLRRTSRTAGSEMPLRADLQAELAIEQLRCEPLIPRTTAGAAINSLSGPAPWAVGRPLVRPPVSAGKAYLTP